MDFVKNLFHGHPGLVRTILAVYMVAIIILYASGHGAWARTLTSFVTFFGVTPDSMGAPFSTETVVAGVLAFVAVLRPVVGWFLPESAPAPAPPVLPPAAK